MGWEALAAKIAGMAIAAILIFALAYFWGRSKGKAAESKVIKDAFIQAGLAEEAFHKVMAEPLDTSDDLLNNWVQDNNN